MSTNKRRRTVLSLLVATPVAVLLLTAGRCPPPRISRFDVVPLSSCPRALVGISWAADAASVTLTVDPPTGETLPREFPIISGGFRFRTAATTTTFTLTAHRGDNPPAVERRTVTILPNPFAITLDMPFDCEERDWRHPGFTEREFQQVLTVRDTTNRSSQPLWIGRFGSGEPHDPGETRPLFPPVRFVGGPWTARVVGGEQPFCQGGPPATNPGGWTSVPPPVQIVVTSTCP